MPRRVLRLSAASVSRPARICSRTEPKVISSQRHSSVSSGVVASETGGAW
jgi:hypothetical protein